MVLAGWDRSAVGWRGRGGRQEAEAYRSRCQQGWKTVRHCLFGSSGGLCRRQDGLGTRTGVQRLYFLRSGWGAVCGTKCGICPVSISSGFKDIAFTYPPTLLQRVRDKLKGNFV